MNKKLRDIRKKVASTLMSVLILTLFIVPLFLTGRWVKDTIFGPSDPRKVAVVAQMQARAVDKTRVAPELFKEPLVSVTFDDGWESTYTQALPLLQEFGIPTTQYIIAGVLNNPVYMSVAQIKSMQHAGHEVASHTMTHPDLTTLTPAQLNWELSESKNILTQYFGPIKDFASPLGAKDPETLKAIAKIYRSQRNTEGDPNTIADKGVNILSEFTEKNVTGFTVRQGTSLQDLQTMLDYAKANNGWLVITYHQVDDSNEEYSVTPEVLRKQLELFSKSRVRISTVGQVLDAYDKTMKAKQ